ncbi:Desmocollin-1 [Cricetulus griseus]|uniref:Desmocollin-1 n=1 Tax=Cricetulus griseus TaxID=10029 RepID=G3I7L6_CRIGR|nr:Desmocollin-1 [Cricetulus griseus]
MAVASAAPGSTFSKQLLFSLLVLVLFCDACRKISLRVPSHLKAETPVGKVNLEECLKSPSTILSSDPAFRILEDGTIYTTRDLLLSSEQKRFSIFLSDSQSLLQKEIEIVLSAKETKIQSDAAQNYTIFYSIGGPGVDKEPFNLFYIEKDTGDIYCTRSIDREQYDQFLYTTEVEENRIDVEILRMKVQDQDLPNTPHSKAVYTILQGNENGYFKITTDPNTNEGVLCVVKPLNYEVNSQVILQIGVLNEAQFSKAANGQTPTMCTTTVTVKIRDSDEEGPECQPPVKVIQSKDGLPAGQELLGYKAMDPETSSSEGIRYQKVGDEDNWFEINESTGVLKTLKVLDRESKFVKNNQYNISVVAMDAIGRSCTGTLVVLLEDFNDHAPQIDRDLTICQQDKDYAILEPVDLDGPDNGPPFQFLLYSYASKLWTLEPQDGILFTCFCVTTTKRTVKKCFPDDVAQQNLIVSNTEGPGEEVTKVYLCGQDEEHKHCEDYVRSYNYEGKGSMAGSVGCCSDRQEEEGLEFLDHLEPKFRTLAKTCVKK